ncbi:MAG: hypothetical protein ACRCXT_18235 [Paraclostridium sp.]
MYNYIRIKEEDIDVFNEIMWYNDNSSRPIQYTVERDPLKFVCEELVDNHIENNVIDDKRELYLTHRDKMIEMIYEDNDILDNNLIVDLLSNYYIEEDEDDGHDFTKGFSFGDL